jgi:hypothetical protein
MQEIGPLREHLTAGTPAEMTLFISIVGVTAQDTNQAESKKAPLRAEAHNGA